MSQWVPSAQATDRIGLGLLCSLMIASAALGLAVSGGCSASGEGEVAAAAAKSDSKGASGVAAATSAPAHTPATGEEVLQAMLTAYRNAASYSDNGTVRIAIDSANQKVDQQVDFAVTFVRPNKLRAQVYQATLVCDGRDLHAKIADLPDQVLAKKAPEQLSRKGLYSDQVLASVMTEQFAGESPQLLLLLEKDPLAPMLRDAEKPVLAEPGEIDGRKYHRVQLKRPDGTVVLWIDQQTYVLRRMIFPTDDLRQNLGRQGEVRHLSLVADFSAAHFGNPVDSRAFQFEMPQGAEIVKFFIPPHPGQLLGKAVPDFKFVDLENQPVTPRSLAGKIAILDFWATWCGPCRQSLPELEKVYQHYKDNPKVAFLAVSVDQPQTENKAVGDTFNELKIHIPIVRDTQQTVGRLFRSTGIPTTFLVDAKGIVQDFEIGGNPELAAVLPQKLEKLLAGENIYPKLLDEYQGQLKKYEEMLEQAAVAEASGRPLPQEHEEIPHAQVAPKSDPKNLRLSPLWKCQELQAPGNILVGEQKGAPPRLLVIEGWKAVAEVALDGKVVAKHPLDIDENEFATALRAVTAADGKQYFAAFASAQQRFHVFDGHWKKLFSFPDDALENKHDGIADVEFGDLDGDGVPELYVGYWGVVGVQAVSLEGKRVAANRSIANVVRLAVGGPTPQEHRHLFCVNNRGSLVAMDEKLQPQGEVTVTDRLLQWVVAADLLGNGNVQWCGLAAPRLGDNVALGLTLEGQELWNYTLPEGVHPQPIERIIPVRLTASPPGQWLLPGPDGSIHVVAADGKLIDHFNYGVPLQGLATVDVDGRPALIVASSQGLEAWRVQ